MRHPRLAADDGPLQEDRGRLHEGMAVDAHVEVDIELNPFLSGAFS